MAIGDRTNPRWKNHFGTLLRSYTNKDGSYGWTFFNKVQLHREIPGLITKDESWIVFHDGFMYGPYDYWYEPIRAFIFEYQNDDHLVM
jgi:hypothetical protein